ncbi:hypothetical protein [Actinophytocola sp. KF-1]
MAEKTKRPGGGKGRRGVFRRPKREAVPAHGTRDFDPGPGDDGDAGSAGVREPRHPKPLGPLADAGELPVPQPPAMVALPDPRR